MENEKNTKIYDVVDELRKKSIEAFLLAIEVYNKPTIKYRLEGCLYFLCNAWELLLKAKLLLENKSIYYKNSNQTLSLSDCLKKVMTNEKDPIRYNMDVIIKLRNLSTHFIIPEYQILASPFLTACAKNYSDKLFEYFKTNINEIIDNDFMTFIESKQIIVYNFDIITTELKALLDLLPNGFEIINDTLKTSYISNFLYMLQPKEREAFEKMSFAFS